MTRKNTTSKRQVRPEDQEYVDQMVEAMEKCNIAPDIIYAFKKTTMLVTKENWDLLSKEDQKEWTDAIKEYSKHKDKRSAI